MRDYRSESYVMETFVYGKLFSLSIQTLSLNKILKVALGYCSCVRMWVILQLGEMFSLLGWFYWKKSFLIKQSF